MTNRPVAGNIGVAIAVATRADRREEIGFGRASGDEVEVHPPHPESDGQAQRGIDDPDRPTGRCRSPSSRKTARCGRRRWRLPRSIPPRHAAPAAAAKRAHSSDVTPFAIGSAAEPSRLQRSIPCHRSPYQPTSYVAHSGKGRGYAAPNPSPRSTSTHLPTSRATDDSILNMSNGL